MAERSTVLLILGMHRSGTSALTRVLNLCGVELGARLMPPAADNNQHGFWEHLEAVDIDERLLHHLGRSWWDTRSLPQGWLDTHMAQASRQRIVALAQGEFAHSPLWALKDPRLCRFLPLWLDALKAAGTDVKLVFMLRHPDEVIASLQRRDGISAAESGMLLLIHFFEAALASAGLPRCVVTYQALMDDWRGCIGRIARELDLALPGLDQAAREVEEFLSPSARHHHAADQDADLFSGSLNGRVYRLACATGSSADFWAGAAELLQTWSLYQRDFVPYVNELQDMLAIRAAMERREAKPLSTAGGSDGRTMSPLTHLQFRMITGLQDGVGRLGQAAADVAAMVRMGTESAVGISGEIAAAVATVQSSLGGMQQDLGRLSAVLEQQGLQQAACTTLEQTLGLQLASLQQEAAASAASQERSLAAVRQQLEGAADLAAARQEQLGNLITAATQRLEAMELREQQREDRRLGRRLRRLFSGK